MTVCPSAVTVVFIEFTSKNRLQDFFIIKNFFAWKVLGICQICQLTYRNPLPSTTVAYPPSIGRDLISLRIDLGPEMSRILINFVDFVSVTLIEGLHVGLDFIAKWKNVLGGRVKSFEKKTDTAVQAGKEKLRQMAISIGANAIIGLRIVPLAVPVSNDSVITVSMYGTAVKTVAVKTQLEGYETGKAPKPVEPGKTGGVFSWKKNREDQETGEQLGEVRNIGNAGRSL